jgi:hypothetical protein
MLDKIAGMLAAMDNSTVEMHQLDLRIYGDGSGQAKMSDAETGTLVWFADFDNLGGLQSVLCGKIYDPAVEVTFADLVDLPGVKAALIDSFEEAAEAADLLDPETIRRVLPVLNQIAAEKGVVLGT